MAYAKKNEKILNWLKEITDEPINNNWFIKSVKVNKPLTAPPNPIKLEYLHIKYGGNIVIPKGLTVGSVILDHPEITEYTSNNESQITINKCSDQLTINGAIPYASILVYKTGLNLNLNAECKLLTVYHDNCSVNSNYIINHLILHCQYIETNNTKINTLQLNVNDQSQLANLKNIISNTGGFKLCQITTPDLTIFWNKHNKNYIVTLSTMLSYLTIKNYIPNLNEIKTNSNIIEYFLELTLSGFKPQNPIEYRQKNRISPIPMGDFLADIYLNYESISKEYLIKYAVENYEEYKTIHRKLPESLQIVEFDDIDNMIYDYGL